jgi:hypothetical protein
MQLASMYQNTDMIHTVVGQIEIYPPCFRVFWFCSLDHLAVKSPDLQRIQRKDQRTRAALTLNPVQYNFYRTEK